MKIIIVGCGRNGAGLALALSKAGHSITVIDSDEMAFTKKARPLRVSVSTGTY